MSARGKPAGAAGFIARQSGVCGSVTTSRNLSAFDKILPSTMDKLVSDGLFVKTGATYTITPKGHAVLRELQGKRDG